MNLERDFEQVMVQLALCGFGATQAWNASGAHTGEPDDKVIIQIRSIHEAPTVRFVRRWDRCRTDAQRESVLRDAEAELKSTRVRESPVSDAPSISFEQAILEDCAGVDPDLVSARYGVYPAWVRRIRVRGGRDSESGWTIEDRALSAGDRRAEAAAMRARGLSLRQIAMHLGVSAEMVRRDLAERKEVRGV